MVYDVFGTEVGGPIHALSIKTQARTLMSDDINAQLRDQIQQAITDNPVILFMKGTPEQPALRLLGAHGGRPGGDRLAVRRGRRAAPPRDPRRSSRRSPTGRPIPQLFVNGELVGGCDIVTEMYESGELAEALGVEQPEDAPEQAPAPGRRQAAADGHREPSRLSRAAGEGR